METPDDPKYPEIHSLVASFPILESLELHPHSKLKILPCYDTTVQSHEMGQVIMDAFERCAHLPGVIVREEKEVLGIISRQRFLSYMSQPYSLELYLQRPIRRLWEMLNASVLELPCEYGITQAVQEALSRPYESLYEPLAVRFSEQVLKVLDLHILLLAQSKLLIEITQLQAKTQAQLQQKNERLEATEVALKEANRELQKQATQDGLTEVSNRRQFDTTLKREWQRLRRSRQPLSLLICDVDEFKRYNDTYGHQAGDLCLWEVAQVINSVAKRPSDLVSRYGGEEFTLLLPDTPLNGAVEVATLIRQTLQVQNIPHQSSRVSSRVTLSIGISCLIPTGNVSPEVLVQQADLALYEAKNQGRDRAVISYK
ncbi:diguanylate cyclase [Halothece sp. PCC 7418]|uniref:GGDEF domain-containing protein n=1 Tax=Halothece sp. (strain PCC 7418) TaxID=65093 RepID=UPI0002A08B32|nr:GGDEF domain-containing protein [Halothece sp. PCC 7418]AFZ44971.1 diguanylate cyclase [Halothece sp. PCC 7418]